jgi:membrane-bound inhibitor of C-type lysozyme
MVPIGGSASTGTIAHSSRDSAQASSSVAPKPLVSIQGISINPNPVVQGSQVSVSAQVSGSGAPFAYSWRNTPPPCSNPGNTSSWQCNPNNPGDYNIVVFVNNTTHTMVHDNATLVVVQALSLSGFSVQPNPVSQGSQFTVSVQVSGGLQPYSYGWGPMPPGCSAGNTQSWSCSESQSGGPYVIGVHISDNSGQQLSAQRSVNVTCNGGSCGNGNHSGNNNNGNNSNGNGSGGFNLSSLGPFLIYGLIAGLIVFALLVTMTVALIMIAITLSRRLPRVPRHGIACPSCHAMAPPGAKFCPACSAPLMPAPPPK